MRNESIFGAPNVEVKHSDLTTDHAFDCASVYREAYSQALAEGAASHAEAGQIATRAHDKAVRWTFDNVGLN